MKICLGPVPEVLLVGIVILVVDAGPKANLGTDVFHPDPGNVEKDRHGNVAKAGAGIYFISFSLNDTGIKILHI